MDKQVFFYKENVVYPFVNAEIKKDLFIVYDTDFCDVISYVEHVGMSIL